jgi:hypothetical protein
MRVCWVGGRAKHEFPARQRWHASQSRLKEERAKLEEAVTRQLEEEHAILLQKKRKEQVPQRCNWRR